MKPVTDRQTDVEKIIIDRSNYLRGLFALLIVLGHCSMAFEKEILPLLIIHKFNMVSVCFFFIVSGWSLSYNFSNKENYLKGFLWKKVIKLFIYALLCELITRIIECIFLNKPIVLNLKILTSFNWYVYELIVFYIAFYCIYSAISLPRKRICFLFLVSCLVSIFTWYMSNKGYPYFWTHAFHFSSLCFVYGAFLHECKCFLIKLMDSRIVTTVVCFVFAAIGCISIKMPQGSFVGGVLLHNLIGICIMTIVIIWAEIFDYRRIPLIGLLTKYSTEIYLYQFVVLSVVSELYNKSGYEINLGYVGIVVCITIGIAIVMHKVDNMIFDLMKKSLRKK